MPRAICWRDWRRTCLHGGERAKKCIAAKPGENYCQEAIAEWPNVAKRFKQEQEKQRK